MKKTKVLAVTASMLVLTSLVFANPKSNTNKSTSGLFKDDTVDCLDTGIEDGKGIAFVELYSKELAVPRDFNVGVGSWINDSLWLGFFYTNSNVFTSNYNKSVAREYHTLDSADPIVDTETTETSSVDNSSYTSALTNSVSLNIFSADSEIGGEVYYTNQISGITKTSANNTKTDEDTVSSGETNKTASSSVTYTFGNNFGVNFTGLETGFENDSNFYLALTGVDVILNGTKSSSTSSSESKKYDDVTGQGSQTNKTYTILQNTRMGGTVKGELGLDFQDFGTMSSSFVFENEIGGYATGITGKLKENSITTTLTERKTIENNTTVKPTANFELVNTATPKFDFTFDAGSRVKVAANISSPIALSYNVNSVDIYETVSTTVVEDLTANTKKTTYATSQNVVNSVTNDVNTFKASVSPEVNAGLVWTVVPEKFNLNFGVKANAGAYEWTNVITKASKRILQDKTVETDEFGVETVTTDYKHAVSSGNNTDSSDWTFTARKAYVRGSFGATLFFSDKASLDMALVNNATSFGLGSLLTATYFDILFNVKF